MRLESVREAVYSCRLHLAQNKRRRARFRQQIALDDYAVPVLYLGSDVSDWAISKDEPSSRSYPDVGEEPDAIYGRGPNILDLELRCASLGTVKCDT